MRDLGLATEDEMILAFLRAEADSPRWRADVRAFLGGDLSLVAATANLDSPHENAARRRALERFRGFGAKAYLFAGFPDNVEWRRVALNCADLGSLRYANHPTWQVLSDGSLLVKDGAANIGRFRTPENADENIRQVERELENGRVYPEIVLAAERPDSQHIVIEGHTRSTAYVRRCELMPDAEYEALVAYSPDIIHWRYY